MQLLERVEEVLNSGDPVVRKWFLIKNSYVPFSLCFLYFLMVQIGPVLMKNRKPYDLRKPMIVFDFIIVFGYAGILLVAAYYLPTISWDMFCWGGVLIKDEPAYILVSAAWFGYVLKYFEFLDTLFFILRKKQNLITFLHVFHHTIVPLIGWIVFRTEKNGLQSIPGIMNSFVHVVMYTYYGLAAMGPSVRKYLWWKKYLTQLQIIQFVLVILFVFTVPSFTGCPMVTMSYLLNIILAPLFLFLFYRFYRMNFHSPPKKAV